MSPPDYSLSVQRLTKTLMQIARMHHAGKEEAEFFYDSNDGPSSHCLPSCTYANCEGHLVMIDVCNECGYEHDGEQPVFRSWPCPTYLAVEAAMETEHKLIVAVLPDLGPIPNWRFVVNMMCTAYAVLVVVVGLIDLALGNPRDGIVALLTAPVAAYAGVWASHPGQPALTILRIMRNQYPHTHGDRAA